MTDFLQKQMQQRADLMESHLQNWRHVLSVEAEERCALEAQHKQELIKLSQSVARDWKTLSQRHLHEREDLIQANVGRRQDIRKRHAEEKALLNGSISASQNTAPTR